MDNSSSKNVVKTDDKEEEDSVGRRKRAHIKRSRDPNWKRKGDEIAREKSVADDRLRSKGIKYSTTTKTRVQQADGEAEKAKASPSLKYKYVRSGNVGNLQADQVDPGKMRDKAAIVEPLRFDAEKEAEAAAKNGDYRRILDYNVRVLPFDSNGPGEYGRPVLTTVFEQRRMEAMWNLSYFNQIVSDKIALERSIPDTRHPGCRDKRYDYASLPTVSVIICFTDEWWSTLVRSVHSVLGRTPPELLREIILVDDFSQRQDLKEPLTSYLDAYPTVRLIRLRERYGLIRARMAGADEARAAVVVFLDSHVECNRGWLEPLLEAIRRNPKTVASPIIDKIDAADFAYGAAPDTIRGGFAWNLQFRWRPIPAAETARRLGDATAPIRTPTIAGGLFAVAREYFDALGRYDPALGIWGSENMELSFKTWMCGGSLEIITCSRVGHVFRSRLPYSTPGTTETFRRNSMRVAHVWMDAYVDVVTKYYPLLSVVDVGDLTDRIRLRKRLDCRSFEWYLRNVYPELYVPSATPLARGQLRNVRTRTCADHGEGGFVQVYPCHGRMGSQYFQLAEDGRLEVFTECVGMFNGTLRAVDCNSPAGGLLRFEHTEPGGPIVERATGLCVGIDPRGEWGHQRLRLTECRQSRDTQKWRFDEYRNDTYVNYRVRPNL